MKLSLVVFAILTAAVAFTVPAAAQNYPWCAQYGGRDSGASNCGFVSFAQCMATVGGIGGFCERNNQYVPPPGPHPNPRVRHRPH